MRQPVWERPWRVGRSVGRTIYVMPPDATEASKDDRLIGLMDTPDMAQHVVDVHNRSIGWPP